jgi:hypothetical protein
VNVSVALPGAALPAAVIVTLCGIPGVSESVVGCAVTPVGSPANVTVTIPANPLLEAAFRLIGCPAPPETSGSAAGVIAREKSPSDTGWDAFPHDIRTRNNSEVEDTRDVLEIEPMSSLAVDQQELSSAAPVPAD